MITHKGIIRFNELSKAGLKDRTSLKAFMLKMMAKEGRRIGRVDYVFCDDDYLLKINRQFLGHDELTDIITFDLSEKGRDLVSEIYISVSRVRENAALFETAYKRELHRVMFHGLLHLAGYGDKKPSQTTEMKKKEEEWLKKYFR